MSHHDDSLSQTCAGQEVHHTQPLGEPEVPKGRGLQGDRVGQRPWRRGGLTCSKGNRFGLRQTRFSWQAAVQVGQLVEKIHTTNNTFLKGTKIFHTINHQKRIIFA